MVLGLRWCRGETVIEEGIAMGGKVSEKGRSNKGVRLTFKEEGDYVREILQVIGGGKPQTRKGSFQKREMRAWKGDPDINEWFPT